MQNLIILLNLILSSTGYERIEAIKWLQNLVWDHPNEIEEFLCDLPDELSLTLDYYEPNPEWRKSYDFLYDDGKLEHVVKQALHE